MAREETALQGMIERLIEIGRMWGKKAKVMRISRQPSPIQITR
jgi:hypothetical protein